jgi:hypothetical protein
MVKTATLEQLSSTLAEQINDQDRYALAETIIVAQVAQRNKLLAEQELLLAEQQKMIEKFDRELKDKVAMKNYKTLNDLLQQKGRLSNDLEKIVLERRSKDCQWANPQAGREPTIQQDLTQYTKGESWRAEWKDAWERYEGQDSFQEAFWDDKKGAPRANMVCDKEHVQAAKRYAGLDSRRSVTFNLYQADDDQEIRDDTGYHSYLAQYDKVEQMDPADIPVMTEDELEQAHDIFMLNVDRGYSEMKPVQEITPGHELILKAEDIFGSPKPSDADLIDISVMTDAKLDGSATENADCTVSGRARRDLL